ncbi:hypothetical protein Sango_0850800 [Sesamum angolense]|uniref:Uncharacterized protein n=1 Tax=Sesamum angolense TaxID=2727404 RepID=A0AAE2C0S0_9LAMI|nr:hypothetical protein Sango_0850800 [Sesamum angolense]
MQKRAITHGVWLEPRRSRYLVVFCDGFYLVVLLIIKSSNTDKSDITSNHGREDVQSEVAMTENSQEQPHPSPAIQNIDIFRKHEVPAPRDASGEVNMEVSVTADDVMRAGGFGTSDSISSLLPVASDFTDLKDHLQRVQGYEDSVDIKLLEENLILQKRFRKLAKFMLKTLTMVRSVMPLKQ